MQLLFLLLLPSIVASACTRHQKCSSWYTANCSCVTCKAGYSLYLDYCCDDSCSQCSYDYPDTCGNGSACQVGQYYYLLGDCLPCNSSLSSQCLECSDADTCDACENGYFLEQVSPTQIDCAYCSANCLKCSNSTNCLECEDQYSLYQVSVSQVVCIQCPENCLNCSSSTTCTDCDTGYLLTAGECEEITDKCGDQVIEIYDCDLELGNQLDGCTDQCEIQDGFQCKIENQTSTCSYSNSFTMELVSMEKEMFANRMHLQFRISPVIYVLKKIDTAALFSFNDTDFQKPAIDFDESSGLITIEFTYPEDIEGRKFMFNFLPSQSTDSRFFATSDQSWVYTLTSGQSLLPALYYTDDEYTYSQFLYFFGFVLVALAFLICIAGIFSPHKLAGLEVMFVVQYAFVCMALLEGFLPLPIYCFGNIQYSIGINDHYDVSTTGTPAQAEMFSLSQLYFSSNMNYFGITYVLPFIVFIIVKIINCCTDKQEAGKKEKLERALEILHELLMYGLMFNLTYFTFCLALFFSHGQLTDLSSEILIALFLLYNVGILIYFFFKPVDFYRFRLIFKATELTFYHYYFHVICIVSGTVLVVVLPDYPWSPFVPQGLLLFYTLINRPYQFIKENLRSALNLLVMCATTSMMVFYYYEANNMKRQWRNYIYPGVIEIGLFLAILMAYFSVIHDFVNQYILEQERKKNLAFEYFNEQQTIKKVQQMVLNNDLFRPTDILNSFVLRDDQSPYDRARQMQRRQRQEQFFSSIKLTPDEEQFMEQLKKQKFSDNKQAIKLMRTQLDFIRYQKAIKESQRFKGQIDIQKLKMFDAI